ncbi:MAG: hypothetical protein CR974_02180 [Gammaproteobacteria bacterium]|nr:MAG: hypothetical protein CR974_02180 [Gammaproteobacteria bacterium]
MIKDKLRAFALHFLVSLLVISLTAYVIFFVWYPAPFYGLYDVKLVFWLLFGIDVIVGPMLTFLVYKKYKKTLKMDLTVIVVIQIVAFVIGIHSIAKARPAWLLIDKQVIYAISPATLSENAKTDMPLSALLKQNWLKPQLVTWPAGKPVVYNDVMAFTQYQSYDKAIGKKQQMSLDFVKDYNVEFYNKLKKQYPKASGYLPIVTDASMTTPVALFNAEGEWLAVMVHFPSSIVESK